MERDTMPFETLIYEENFDSNVIDDSVWTHEVGEKWFNNESQAYVDDRNHSFVKDSCLNLVATYDPQDRLPFQSARLTTYGKKHFQYGKFVLRAKMPKGKGAWPALWFLGCDRKKHVPWPLCGEIDLCEFSGNRPQQVTCAIHTATFNHKIHTQKGARLLLNDASDAFHDYILEWTEQTLRFIVDETEILRFDKEEGFTEREWPFDKPYYMILNLAVGGWYGGDIAPEDLPFHLQIDSIKVYQ